MNEIQTVTKNVRLQQWTSIIKDCNASGLKVGDSIQIIIKTTYEASLCEGLFLYVMKTCGLHHRLMACPSYKRNTGNNCHLCLKSFFFSPMPQHLT